MSQFPQEFIKELGAAAAIFISVLLLGIRFRDTIMPPKKPSPESNTDELRAIRDELNRLRIERIEQELKVLRDDITDTPTLTKRTKTQPISNDILDLEDE